MSAIAYVDGPEKVADHDTYLDDADLPHDRTTHRALRPGRTPAGIIVALATSLLAWAATAEALAVALDLTHELGPAGRLADRLAGLAARPWADPVVTGVACAFVVVGVLLVALAVTPGRPRLVPLETADPLLAAGLTRSGLRRTLVAAARTVPGADTARVRLRGRGRRIEVRVRTEARRTGGLLPQVSGAVGHRLAALGAQSGHEVVVRLRPKRI